MGSATIQLTFQLASMQTMYDEEKALITRLTPLLEFATQL